jgi:hypothetical protein
MILKTTLAAMMICLGTLAHAQNEGSSTFRAPTRPYAADEWRTHVGILAGYTNAEGDYNSALGYGVDWGVQPYIPFGMGVELASTENEGD